MSSNKNVLFLPSTPSITQIQIIDQPQVDHESVENWWYESVARPFSYDGWIHDKKRHKVHTASMSDITREELDAKLDATQAKVDARLSAFEFTVKEAVSAIRQDSAEARAEIRVMHAELGALKNIKSSIWGAAGATILGIVGLSTAVMSLGVSSYDTGRENTALAQEAKAQITESRKAVEEALKAIAAQAAMSQQQAEDNRKVLEQVQARLKPASK